MKNLLTSSNYRKSVKRRCHDVILKDLQSKEYALEKGVLLIRRFRSNESSSSSERDSDIDEVIGIVRGSVKTQKSAYVLAVFNST